MLAKRIHTQWAPFSKRDNRTLRVMTFSTRKSHINNVSRGRPRDKHHSLVNSCDSFSFSRHVRHLHALNDGARFFLSCQNCNAI